MRQAAMPARRTYAERLDALADLINRITPMHSDPHALHQRRDQAARQARALAAALRADGL